MYRMFLVGIVFVLGASFAQAEEVVYLCQYGKQKFTSSAEQKEAAKEADPVQFILVAIDEKPDLLGMKIGHVAKSGRVFDRGEQYTGDVRKTMNGYLWRGVYDRNTDVMMVGKLRTDIKDTTYTETRFRKGIVEWSIVTKCSILPPGK